MTTGFSLVGIIWITPHQGQRHRMRGGTIEVLKPSLVTGRLACAEKKG